MKNSRITMRPFAYLAEIIHTKNTHPQLRVGKGNCYFATILLSTTLYFGLSVAMVIV